LLCAIKIPIPISSSSTHNPKDMRPFSGKKYLAARNNVHTMQRAMRKWKTNRIIMNIFSEPKARMPRIASVRRKDMARKTNMKHSTRK